MSMLRAGEREGQDRLEEGSRPGGTHPSNPYCCMTATSVRANVLREVAVATCVEKYLLEGEGVSDGVCAAGSGRGWRDALRASPAADRVRDGDARCVSPGHKVADERVVDTGLRDGRRLRTGPRQLLARAEWRRVLAQNG